MSTLNAALRAAVAQLEQAGIDGPARDARLLLAHALGVDPGRVTLLLHDDAPDLGAFDALVQARCRHVPVSHLLGYRDFYGRRFEVTDQVLDPRPETETLVAEALAQPFETVLDLGTGSGAILLSLLAERPSAKGQGSDLSPEALQVAARNAQRLGVAPRCDLFLSDWFAQIGGRFDLIVSNPPYIAAQEMADLAPELAFEPRLALTDEHDGLSAYRIIIGQAPQHLHSGGRLLVEIGWQQGAAVLDLMGAAGFEAALLPDLNGHDRVVRGIWR